MQYWSEFLQPKRGVKKNISTLNYILISLYVLVGIIITLRTLSSQENFISKVLLVTINIFIWLFIIDALIKYKLWIYYILMIFSILGLIFSSPLALIPLFLLIYLVIMIHSNKDLKLRKGR